VAGGWKLEGYDTFEGEEYPLGAESGLQESYATYEEALSDARSHLSVIERQQPTASSGGQEYEGIQDRVYVVHPGGRRERVFPAGFEPRAHGVLPHQRRLEVALRPLPPGEDVT